MSRYRAAPLFPKFELTCSTWPPPWADRAGLSRRTRLSKDWPLASEYAKVAVDDGISQVVPFIAFFARPPEAIRNIIGKGAWKKVHASPLNDNIVRVDLMTSPDQFTVPEAMGIVPNLLETARSILFCGKRAVLYSCSKQVSPREASDFARLWHDCERMGVGLNPLWSPSRLKREHDAAAMAKMLEKADPKPWAPFWQYEEDGYLFTLLRSEADFAMEGITQRHCVRSYVSYARSGKEVVLRIEGRERGTCSWNKRHPAIQVKGHRNSDLSPAAQMAAAKAREAYDAPLANGEDAAR